MSSSRQIKRAVRQRQMGKLLLLSAAWLLSIYPSFSPAAGFATNFQSEATSWGGQNTGFCTYGNCTSQAGNNDPTSVGLTIVQIDAGDGQGPQYYFHHIVGDPATGFATESYTRASGLTGTSPSNINIPNGGGAFSPDGGGLERTLIGNGTSPQSLGLLQGALFSNPLGNNLVSGTGTQDPTKMVFRMVLTDPSGDMSIEVIKPFLDKKPRISQTISQTLDAGTPAESSITAGFVVDERALGYNDLSTPAPVVNNLVLSDPKFPNAGEAYFDMALAQNPEITAGRYTYTPGTGWDNAVHDPTLGWNADDSTFDRGTYTYVGSGPVAIRLHDTVADVLGGTVYPVQDYYDPTNFNWGTVFNYSDNIVPCTQAGGGNSVVREQVGDYGQPVGATGGSCFNKP